MKFQVETFNIIVVLRKITSSSECWPSRKSTKFNYLNGWKPVFNEVKLPCARRKIKEKFPSYLMKLHVDPPKSPYPTLHGGPTRKRFKIFHMNLPISKKLCYFPIYIICLCTLSLAHLIYHLCHPNLASVDLTQIIFYVVLTHY